MTALYGAVALEQVTNVAVPVGHHLELDVSRPLEEPLEIDLRGPEAPLRHRPGATQHLEELPAVAGRQHADSPAAARRLDEDGKPDLPGGGERRLVVAQDAEPAPAGIPRSFIVSRARVL